MSIDRKHLQKRLKKQVSSLRTRGMDEPEVGDLEDLVQIAAIYAPRQPSDAERVEKLIEDAIAKKYGGTKMAKVARLTFGSDPETRGLALKDRYNIAWRASGEGSEKTFTSHGLSKISGGIASQIRLFYERNEVAEESEVGESDSPVEASPDNDPEDQLQKAPGDATDQEQPSPVAPKKRGPFGMAIWIILPIGWVCVIALTVILTLRNGSSSGTEPPPKPGAVVNAMTGELVDHPDRQPPAKGNRPEVGPVNFCDFSLDPEGCEGVVAPSISYRQFDPFVGRIGEVIEARFRLWNSGPKPIPLLRLNIKFGDDVKSIARRFTPVVSWLRTDGGASSDWARLPVHGAIHVLKVSSNPDFLRVAYIHGSTQLLNSSGETIASLPDGIMDDRGIYLANLGAPENCLCSTRPYAREVSFRFKLAFAGKR